MTDRLKAATVAALESGLSLRRTREALQNAEALVVTARGMNAEAHAANSKAQLELERALDEEPQKEA